jgi:hypothetical protein
MPAIDAINRRVISGSFLFQRGCNVRLPTTGQQHHQA